jgi:hypothetical protein
MDDSKILAIVEERTRLLPEMDKRLRLVAENQKELNSRVGRNENDIKDVIDKVDNLKIWDRVWNGLNSAALVVIVWLMTGKTP